MDEEQLLIKGCKQFQQSAQKALYERYNTLLRSVCMRYTNTLHEAEDVLQDSFIKIFSQIKKFKWQGENSFKNWAIRVTINTAISFNKKNKNHKYQLNIEEIGERAGFEETVGNSMDTNIENTRISEINKKNINYEIIKQVDFSKEEMLDIIKTLPSMYRDTFNMHVIEGFKHKEIASMLGIEERSSRTRLLRARKLIQNIMYEKSIEKLKAK